MMRKKRFIRFIAVILVVGGIAAFALWSRPALELYTTPPLDSKGTRIQLLIPRGWHKGPPGPMARFRIENYALLLADKSEPWYPRWVQRLLHQEEDMSSLLVWVVDPDPRLKDTLELTHKQW